MLIVKSTVVDHLPEAVYCTVSKQKDWMQMQSGSDFLGSNVARHLSSVGTESQLVMRSYQKVI